MSTALVYHEDYLLHDTGPHPENRQRLESVVAHLKREGIWGQCQHPPPRAASREEVLACHAEEHWNRIHDLGTQASAAQRHFRADPDTVVSPKSVEVALLATGGAITAAESVLAGKASNAFALIRPPGHHATPDRAMGFCLFNNIAIAARFAQRKHGIAKVAIVDWDVHHGNGTQDIFYSDPSVFFFSVHQHPWYPGTGMAEETGEGKAKGTKLNVPLPAGKADSDYVKVFIEKVAPALEKFKPNFMLISAGYDARIDDPLGRMRISDAGFAELTRIVRTWSERFCNGKFVALLEGGYNLQGLPLAVAATLREMLA